MTAPAPPWFIFRAGMALRLRKSLRNGLAMPFFPASRPCPAPSVCLALFPTAELFVDVVEQFLAARHARLIRSLGAADARNDMGYSGGLRVAELSVLQIHVVNDLADGLQCRVCQARAQQ